MFSVENLTEINNGVDPAWSRPAIDTTPGTVWQTDYNTRFDAVVEELVSTIFNGCCSDTIIVSGGAIVWVDTYADLPATGIEGVLYIVKDTGKGYRWEPAASESDYVEVFNEVLEYDTYSLFPATGIEGFIYIDKTTNKLYRWEPAASESDYVELSPPEPLDVFAYGNTVGTSSGSIPAGMINISGAGIISVGMSSGTIVVSGLGGGGGSINVSAGTTSNNLTNLVFNDANGVSFGLDGSTVTGSHNGLTSQSNQALSGSNGSFTFQTASFGTVDGFTFYTSNGSMVGSHNGLTSQSNQALSGSNGSFAFQTASFGNLNGLSFYTSNGSMVGSYTVPAVPAQFSGGFSTDGNTAGDTGFVTGRLAFEADNYITLSGSTDAGSMTISIHGEKHLTGVAVGANTIPLYSTSVEVEYSSVAFSGAGLLSVGMTASGGEGVFVYSVPLIELSGSNGKVSGHQFTFGNLNGMSFYTSNGSMVGSYTVPTQTNQTVGLYAVSNTTQGTSGTQDARSITFAGAGNVSVGVTNGSVVISGAGGVGGGSVNFSAGTTSGNLTAVTFADSNGVSFGLDAGTITASHNGLTSQSNQALSGSNGSFTFQTATFGNANGMSFLTSNGSMVGSYTVPSVAGLISAINVSAGTTSNNMSAVTFDNVGGVSFGLNGSVVTAVASGIKIGVSNDGNTVGNTAVAGYSSFVLVGDGDITLSQATGANIASVRISRQVNSSFVWPQEQVTTVGSVINTVQSLMRFNTPYNLTATVADVLVSIGAATAANNSSGAWNASVTFALYSTSGVSYKSIATSTTQYSTTWSSNSTGSVAGVFNLTMPFAFSGPASQYFFGCQISTAATGGILTGANTTSLANTFIMFGMGTAVNGIFSVRTLGGTTNSTQGWFVGMGLNSSTGNVTQPEMSNVSVAGTLGQRANIAVRFRA
jgi:hypothetical protein